MGRTKPPAQKLHFPPKKKGAGILKFSRSSHYRLGDSASPQKKTIRISKKTYEDYLGNRQRHQYVSSRSSSGTVSVSPKQQRKIKFGKRQQRKFKKGSRILKKSQKQKSQRQKRQRQRRRQRQGDRYVRTPTRRSNRLAKKYSPYK